jgi:hypothetical protein
VFSLLLGLMLATVQGTTVVLEDFEQPKELRLGGMQIHPSSQVRLSTERPLKASDARSCVTALSKCKGCNIWKSSPRIS